MTTIWDMHSHGHAPPPQTRSWATIGDRLAGSRTSSPSEGTCVDLGRFSASARGWPAVASPFVENLRPVHA